MKYKKDNMNYDVCYINGNLVLQSDVHDIVLPNAEEILHEEAWDIIRTNPFRTIDDAKTYIHDHIHDEHNIRSLIDQWWDHIKSENIIHH